MDLNEFYRLTLSNITMYSDWSYSNEEPLGVISYTSPYVYNFDTNNSCSYKHIIDQNFTNQYIEKYFSPFNTIKSNPTDSGLLSPGLKSVGNNYIVFEKPPCFKNIFYIPTSRDEITEDADNQQVFRIPLPWQLYLVKFNPNMYVYQVNMFFMKNSLTSVDQELFLPPIPNFYTNGMLCPPIMDNMEDVDRYPKNYAGIIESAYDWVWNSGTNHDLTEACIHAGFQLNQDNSILKYMPEPIYNNYFKTIYNNPFNTNSRYSANYKQVTHLLTSWEKSSLTEVCHFSWPNISGSKTHFVTYPDNVTEINGYYDYLYEFMLHLDDSMTDEEAESMIENGDYDSEEYYRYLRGNNLIPSLSSFPWKKTYLYSDVLPQFISSLQVDLDLRGSTLPYDINRINVNNDINQINASNNV